MLGDHFNLKKNIQIIAYILSKNDNKINYTKLIKLLYLADRKSLELYNYPITGDIYFSMPQGPVLSKILDFIKQNSFIPKPDKEEWNTYFEIPYNDKHYLKIKNSALPLLADLLSDNNMELSDANIEILDEIDKTYKDKNYSEVINVIHDEETYPEIEWQEAKKYETSISLPIENILKALNKSEKEIECYKNEAETHESIVSFFSEKGINI